MPDLDSEPKVRNFMSARKWLTIFLIAVAAAAETARAAQSDEQRIRDLDKEILLAVAAKDPAKTAAFYAEDGTLMSANMPIVYGRAKIQETWAAWMANSGFAMHMSSTRIEVAKAHDIAFDMGTYEMTFNDETGKPDTVVGKYLVIWKKQKNGDWKVEVDTGNLDK
jgi:uncharacterized protein (TIGR02246 family)